MISTVRQVIHFEINRFNPVKTDWTSIWVFIHYHGNLTAFLRYIYPLLAHSRSRLTFAIYSPRIPHMADQNDNTTLTAASIISCCEDRLSNHETALVTQF